MATITAEPSVPSAPTVIAEAAVPSAPTKRSIRVTNRILTPQPVFDEQSLLATFRENHIKPIHAATLWKYMCRHEVTNFAYSTDSRDYRHPEPSGVPFAWREVPDLPQTAYRVLEEQFTPLTSRLVKATTSSTRTTTKLLIELQDKQMVEAVIIRHEKEGSEQERRVTLCVSSQVGCQMGCTFCATGTMGLKGNLTSGEILEQVIHASKYERIRNVVFMGMGEPLNNYENVIASIKAMSDASRFGLSPSRITLSTVGIVPKMLRLTRDAPFVNLALSLHAPTQDLRCKIVPAARAFKLDRLMDALDDHLFFCKKQVLIEYVLLEGVNDSEQNAHELGQLLQSRAKDLIVNLIPYNPTEVAESYQPPSQEQINKFVAIAKTYDLFVTVRQENGSDVDAACGQLALKEQGQGCNGGDCESKEHDPLAISSATGFVKGPSMADIEDIIPHGVGRQYRARRPKKTRSRQGSMQEERKEAEEEEVIDYGLGALMVDDDGNMYEQAEHKEEKSEGGLDSVPEAEEQEEEKEKEKEQNEKPVEKKETETTVASSPSVASTPPSISQEADQKQEVIPSLSSAISSSSSSPAPSTSTESPSSSSNSFLSPVTIVLFIIGALIGWLLNR